ncbi:hypothetical protein [Nocardia sp. NPDC057227]|uniref:phage terminase small subunit n=1 Tax=Nocardia sp. NPDC057227 TaxID=3346056 RepID=UPI00362DF54F
MIAVPGPVPKPASRRRRRNKPKSQGEAEAELVYGAVDAPELGFDAHSLVSDLYETLACSVEGQFYSPADWQRVRLELHYLNGLLTAEKVPGAMAWAQVQAALQALLVSPAEKRRLGIEMRRPVVDADEDAAVVQMNEYVNRFSG